MPIKDENRIQEENQKAWEAAIAAADEKKNAAPTPSPESSKKPAKEDKTVKVVPSFKGAHGAKILEAYKEYAKYHSVNIDEKTGALVFEGRKDAVTFFKNQAELGCAFFVKEICDGTPVDFYMLSCGDKHFYKGKLADIKTALEADIKKQPENAALLDGLETINKEMAVENASKNQATKMREQLQGHRGHDANDASDVKTPTKGHR
jgi:hypothetical protein